MLSNISQLSWFLSVVRFLSYIFFNYKKSMLAIIRVILGYSLLWKKLFNSIKVKFRKTLHICSSPLSGLFPVAFSAQQFISHLPSPPTAPPLPPPGLTGSGGRVWCLLPTPPLVKIRKHFVLGFCGISMHLVKLSLPPSPLAHPNLAGSQKS